MALSRARAHAHKRSVPAPQHPNSAINGRGQEPGSRPALKSFSVALLRDTEEGEGQRSAEHKWDSYYWPNDGMVS